MRSFDPTRRRWTQRLHGLLVGVRGEFVSEYVVVLGVLALGIAAVLVLMHGAGGGAPAIAPTSP